MVLYHRFFAESWGMEGIHILQRHFLGYLYVLSGSEIPSGWTDQLGSDSGALLSCDALRRHLQLILQLYGYAKAEAVPGDADRCVFACAGVRDHLSLEPDKTDHQHTFGSIYNDGDLQSPIRGVYDHTDHGDFVPGEKMPPA